jgi:hypothetical protein
LSEKELFVSLPKIQKYKNMKTHSLLLFLLLSATPLLAQREDDLYSLWYGSVAEYEGEGQYCMAPVNLMQQRNGDFFIATDFAMEPYSAQLLPVYLGNVFYKVSSSDYTLTDSLFQAVTDTVWPPYYLFARNPQGEGNIRANLEYDEESNSTFLRICHFYDDSYYINHEEDILSLLCEGRAYDEKNGYLMDCRGDIIVKYSVSSGGWVYDNYMARFGIDGTLKHRALFPENQGVVIPNMRVLEESPLQYYQWRGYNDNNLAIQVIDSAFHLQNTAVVNKLINEVPLPDTSGWVEYEYLDFGNDTEVIPLGGDEVLIAAQYVHDTGFDPMMADRGVAVAKYDMRTMQREGLVIFNDYPGWDNGANCLGLKRMSDGSVYFLYKGDGYPAETIIIVKMDADLNIEWKRFCKIVDIVLPSPLSYPILYDDGQGEEKGIAWTATGTRTSVEGYILILFLIHHDGTVGISESGITARPYAFYPNPVHSQLHMAFSPDVQPAQVELYDMQGRLVGSQRNSFEYVDMSPLSTGIYLMRVVMKDGQVYTEKVVKE